MTLVVGNDLDPSTTLNTVEGRKLSFSHDTSPPSQLTQRKNTSCRDLKEQRQPPYGPQKVFMRLTNTNDGSKLGLLVIISSVDRDGAQEDESQDGEEDEGH